jgi:hypothetical protein
MLSNVLTIALRGVAVFALTYSVFQLSAVDAYWAAIVHDIFSLLRLS